MTAHLHFRRAFIIAVLLAAAFLAGLLARAAMHIDVSRPPVTADTGGLYLWSPLVVPLAIAAILETYP